MADISPTMMGAELARGAFAPLAAATTERIRTLNELAQLQQQERMRTTELAQQATLAGYERALKQELQRQQEYAEDLRTQRNIAANAELQAKKIASDEYMQLIDIMSRQDLQMYEQDYRLKLAREEIKARKDMQGEELDAAQERLIIGKWMDADLDAQHQRGLNLYAKDRHKEALELQKKGQDFQKGERIGAEQFQRGERIGSQQFQKGERVESQNWRTKEREGAEKHELKLEENREGYRQNAEKRAHDRKMEDAAIEIKSKIAALGWDVPETNDLTLLSRQLGIANSQADDGAWVKANLPTINKDPRYKDVTLDTVGQLPPQMLREIRLANEAPVKFANEALDPRGSAFYDQGRDIKFREAAYMNEIQDATNTITNDQSSRAEYFNYIERKDKNLLKNMGISNPVDLQKLRTGNYRTDGLTEEEKNSANPPFDLSQLRPDQRQYLSDKFSEIAGNIIGTAQGQADLPILHNKLGSKALILQQATRDLSNLREYESKVGLEAGPFFRQFQQGKESAYGGGISASETQGTGFAPISTGTGSTPVRPPLRSSILGEPEEKKLPASTGPGGSRSSLRPTNDKTLQAVKEAGAPGSAPAGTSPVAAPGTGRGGTGSIPMVPWYSGMSADDRYRAAQAQLYKEHVEDVGHIGDFFSTGMVAPKYIWGGVGYGINAAGKWAAGKKWKWEPVAPQLPAYFPSDDAAPIPDVNAVLNRIELPPGVQTSYPDPNYNPPVAPVPRPAMEPSIRGSTESQLYDLYPSAPSLMNMPVIPTNSIPVNITPPYNLMQNPRTLHPVAGTPPLPPGYREPMMDTGMQNWQVPLSSFIYPGAGVSGVPQWAPPMLYPPGTYQ